VAFEKLKPISDEITQNPKIDQKQKAEFHYYNALFHAKEKRLDAANEEFVRAVKLQAENWKIWNDWGFFFYKNYIAALQGKAPGEAQSDAEADWAGQALFCLFTAALFNPSQTRMNVVAIFTLVHFNPGLGSPLVQKFAEHMQDVPTWVWLPWTPQLLSAYLRHKKRLFGQCVSRVPHFPVPEDPRGARRAVPAAPAALRAQVRPQRRELRPDPALRSLLLLPVQI
jgi:hypothetical protein